jgi:hypothetical protein
LDGASWWHIKGLELKDGPINGLVADQNSSNNIFERLHIHHIGRLGNAGGQGTVLRITAGGINNLVLNNDVHDNEDQQSFGGGANGISLSGAGSGNVIRGNRAWCNSDDGIDTWTGAPALIDNNWVWDSGRGINCRATGGNGVGFKLGGTTGGSSPAGGGHTVKNNLAWRNGAAGFHESSGALGMKLYNNTAWNNQFNYIFGVKGGQDTLKNNASFGKLGNVSGASTANNSWNLPVTVNDADFAGLGNL